MTLTSIVKNKNARCIPLRSYTATGSCLGTGTDLSSSIYLFIYLWVIYIIIYLLGSGYHHGTLDISFVNVLKNAARTRKRLELHKHIPNLIYSSIFKHLGT